MTTLGSPWVRFANRIGEHVADMESRRASQQTSLRELLAAQGLTVSAAADGLPALDTLQCFAAQQLAGVEAELAGLGGAVSLDGSTECRESSAAQKQAPAEPDGVETANARWVSRLDSGCG